MGLSLSLISSAWEKILYIANFELTSHQQEMILRTDSFKKIDFDFDKNKSNDSGKLSRTNSIKMNCEPLKVMLETSLSFKNLLQVQDIKKSESTNSIIRPEKSMPTSIQLPEPAILFSPRPVSELDAAATNLQKVYKGYRTRRNLADCAVVIEELWWKTFDLAALERSSVSFFNVDKPETAVSRWSRARTRAARVGKGLCQNEKAQKLALQHWLEAIDVRHRYGHNLHMYYDLWFESQSSQPFFYWLDIGDGKEINLEKCPRARLQHQCIKYLGPIEREAYEVIVENGKLVFRNNGMLLETTEGSKWIFVLSTMRNLYVGQKKKGVFQHSSFLSGGATTAAGRLVAHGGVLEAIWPYSGHYHPTEENFREFISFLEENNVDLTNVKRCSIDEDEDSFSFKVTAEESKAELADNNSCTTTDPDCTTISDVEVSSRKPTISIEPPPPSFNFARPVSCKWTSRIGIVRDYPAELQFRALEQVNLSPRVAHTSFVNYGPIPSPRPSPKVRLSPRLSYMGIPSPRTPIAAAN